MEKLLKTPDPGLSDQLGHRSPFSRIITSDKSYIEILQDCEQIAKTDCTVLVSGETGTGKEILGEAIHQASLRKDQPFIKINCATLSEHLIESELFGHEKGAFTGAFQQKPGRFELANGGSIFLDEIGELPLHLQPKLLRVLQDGSFERVGGVKTIKVDVRIIAATNQNLEDLIRNGRFRQDLFYRLNVFPVFNPPLRNRKADIPLLVRFFLKKYAVQYGKLPPVFSNKQMSDLLSYHFPGNIRELENIVQRAVVLTRGDTVDFRKTFTTPFSPPVDKDFKTFEEMQRQHILAALQMTNWRVSGPRGAAKLLDLNPNTLETKMRRLGIKRPKI